MTSRTETTKRTKVFLTIERPNGITEEVDVTGRFLAPISKTTFDRIYTATLNAGRGKVLGYHTTVVTCTRELSEVDLVDRSYERTMKAMSLNGRTF